MRMRIKINSIELFPVDTNRFAWRVESDAVVPGPVEYCCCRNWGSIRSRYSRHNMARTILVIVASNIANPSVCITSVEGGNRRAQSAGTHGCDEKEDDGFGGVHDGSSWVMERNVWEIVESIGVSGVGI